MHGNEPLVGVMSELMREGKILHWGLSEMSEEYLRRAHAVCLVTVIQNRNSKKILTRKIRSF